MATIFHDKIEPPSTFGIPDKNDPQYNSSKSPVTFTSPRKISQKSVPSTSTLPPTDLTKLTLPKLPINVMNAIILTLTLSSVTWVPLMILGGKNKHKSKKINKRIYHE